MLKWGEFSADIDALILASINDLNTYIPKMTEILPMNTEEAYLKQRYQFLKHEKTINNVMKIENISYYCFQLALFRGE